MNLIGKKVLLRELRSEDMELLNNLINNPEIENAVVGWSKPVTMNEQNDWFNNLKNDTSIRYAICNIENEAIAIGTAIIRAIDWKNRSACFDIKINQENSGKGIGTDTITTLLKYCFEELNLNRIAVNILDYNLASQRLFTKCGFQLEGEQRKAIFKNNKYNNLLLYSILREDYFRERNR